MLKRRSGNRLPFGAPFSIVSGDVPVTLRYGSYPWFDVTFTAPSSSWSGALYVMITASEN